MARNRRERPAAHAVAHADVGDCERRRVTRLRACGDATHCRQRKIIADLVRAHEVHDIFMICVEPEVCLLYTSPSPRDKRQSRMPSSA